MNANNNDSLSLIFLQQIAQRHFEDPTIEIQNVELSPLGFNIVCKVNKYVLTGHCIINNEKRDFCCTFVIKQQHNDHQVFKDVFYNEIFAYNVLLPELEKIHLLMKPEMVHSTKSLIIVEYLKNFFLNDLRTPLPMKRIFCTLDELAKFHSSSFILQKLRPHLLQTLSLQLKDCLFCAEETLLNSSFKQNINFIINLYRTLERTQQNAKVITLLEAYSGNFHKNHADIIHTIHNKERKFKVLNHGDLWAHNLLFESKNDKVALIDFQAMRFTSPAYDLTCFLCTSLINTKLRRENLQGLLEFYLEKLKFYTTSLQNGEVDSELNMEWLVNEMNEFRIIGFLISTWILPVFFMDWDELQRFASLSTENKCLRAPDDYTNALIDLCEDYFLN